MESSLERIKQKLTTRIELYVESEKDLADRRKELEFALTLVNKEISG